MPNLKLKVGHAPRGFQFRSDGRVRVRVQKQFEFAACPAKHLFLGKTQSLGEDVIDVEEGLFRQCGERHQRGTVSKQPLEAFAALPARR